MKQRHNGRTERDEGTDYIIYASSNRRMRLHVSESKIHIIDLKYRKSSVERREIVFPRQAARRLQEKLRNILGIFPETDVLPCHQVSGPRTTKQKITLSSEVHS